MTTGLVTVRGRWFPADVMLPDVPSRPWHRCYVIVTDVSLHVWRTVSDIAEWESPVDWSATVLPGTDTAARNGFDVVTGMGLVVVTLGSGCKCGSLGHWAGPSWAQRERQGQY